VKKPVAPLVLFACSMMLAACDTTPPAVSTLMQQVTQACKDQSKDELRACFAKEGVTAQQIDQHVGGWDAYLDKTDPAYAWTYTGITYVSMADAPNNNAIMPEWIDMAKPSNVGGMKFAPNLTVIGFLLISFKQANGMSGGETEDVGMASDGTAKIALSEPQR
jgi:hypothetical protein